MTQDSISGFALLNTECVIFRSSDFLKILKNCEKY